MQRRTSRDKRYKKSVWSQNQKLQAVSTYLMLGNMAETAIVTGIPLPTLKLWKQMDWFKEFRSYHRKDGKIVPMNDDLMSATRYACMSVERYGVSGHGGSGGYGFNTNKALPLRNYSYA